MPEPSAVTPEPRPFPEPAMAGSSGLRRALLVRLRHDGPSSPEHLAEVFGVSRTGVLQQLHALETAGLVERQAVRHGVGRPRHVYDVTDAAQDLFPTNYDGLATGLLSAILEVGGEALVEEVFAARRRQAEARLRDRLATTLPEDAPMIDRMAVVAGLQDELGYLAEARDDGEGARLVEHNCAVLDVARSIPAACQAELDLFRSVLGVELVRESHIVSGDRCCRYRVAD
jgi:predicted ArsR family transcriptional regulator